MKKTSFGQTATQNSHPMQQELIFIERLPNSMALTGHAARHLRQSDRDDLTLVQRFGEIRIFSIASK
jgi:hypothetical protein